MNLASTLKSSFNGSVRCPGDRSISQRVLMVGSSINEPIKIEGFLEGEDPLSTMRALNQMGADIAIHPNNIFQIKKILSKGKDLKIITVGSKGLDQIKREYGKYVIKKFSFKEKKQITFEEANIVGNEIISLFNQNEFDKCILFFNNFKNVITQIPQEQQIIPLKTNEEKETNSDSSYEFEPEEDEILSNLLPKNISTQIFKAMLENSASEQGSRMSAMDNATRNAGEMVDKLTIQYNRSRQAAITKELIEIISGAESL